MLLLFLVPYLKGKWHFTSAVETKHLPKASAASNKLYLGVVGLYFNSDGGTQQQGVIV